jgi:hypothetical protein
MRRNWWIDAIGIGIGLIAVFPELSERRTWLFCASRLAREGARRCGQLAIAAEQAYAREIV